jgi:predicted RNA-binding protein associated with RNAse of E/G family
MKQKYANRPNWSRINKKRYFQEYVQDEIYEGYISLLYLDQVREPLTVKYGNHDIRIVDHGYSWIMFFPDNKHFSLTVMVDNNNEIKQWYFDIVKSIKLSDEGIPVIEDLYLDLVVLPNGEYYILDEDELTTAFDEGIIDTHDYKLATDELEELRKSIERGENGLINNTERYQRLIKKKYNES